MKIIIGKKMPMRLAILGLMLFLGIRIYMIGVSYFVMGLPRLGDDSYLYVSKGVGFFSNYNHGSQLQKSVDDQISLQTETSEIQQRTNWRILNQAYGGATFVYDFFSGSIQTRLRNSKLTFAIMEFFVAIAMTLCFFYFYLSIWGLGSAGISLAELSSVLLPVQGIHYLIPSTLALSLGFLLIAISVKQKPQPVKIFALSIYISFLHNIGFLWIFIALIAFIFRHISELTNARQVNLKELAKYLFLYLGPIGCKSLLVKQVTFFSLPYSNLTYPSKPIFTTVETNITGFLSQALSSSIEHCILLSCAIIFIVWSKVRRTITSIELILLFLFIFIFLASFVVFIAFYPGEVAMRTFTALNVFVFGFLGHGLYKLFICKKRRYAVFAIFIFTLVILSNARKFNENVVSQFQRPFVIDDKKFRDASLKLDAAVNSLLFIETEYSFRVAVISGLEKFPTYLWPLLKQQPFVRKFFQTARPSHIVFPAYRHLSTAIFDKRSKFSKQHLGIDLGQIKSFRLKGLISNSVTAKLKIKNRGPQTSFIIEENNKIRQIFLDPSEEKYINITTRQLTTTGFSISDNSNIWITGLNIDEDQASDWPWGKSVVLELNTNQNSVASRLTYDFSFKEILKIYSAEEIETLAEKIVPVHDQSGIVLAKIYWKADKQ